MHSTAIFTLIFMVGSVGIANLFGGGDAKDDLHALFDEDWQWRLEQFPEAATLLGDNRYNDRLTDLSSDAIERRKRHEREMLDRIQKIDRSKLAGQDLISYDLFLQDKKLNVEGERFSSELMPINQMEGVQLSFPQLAGSTPFRNSEDYQKYLARLAAFSKQIDQIIELMKRGIEKKWTQPAVPLRSVPSQIEGQIVSDPAKSPLAKPFADFPQELSASDRARFTADGGRLIAESVMPALEKLQAFFKDTYLPACRREIAASSLPDGEAYYSYSIVRNTTTNLSPKEIHETGKREVARIRKEMEAVIRQVKFKGSFQEFLTFLRTDPRFYYTKAEDLVRAYRDIAKRADGELPELFAELPRTPYGVREIPDYEAPAQTTAYYQPSAADGSRAGYYWVNTYKLNTRPKYEMEALSLHEAVPGHHLQIARAQELKGLPDFRRNAGYTAYVEGWALYAESLGSDMGFYTDPYSKFGQLTYEMWRACRLVVDTGMHALGWSREQAIDFMKENTAKTENDIIVEVDRYIVWPGQALAYKLGELKIKELRTRARQELKDRFDIRRFHNAVLDDGSLPLDLLEKRIGEWIVEEKRKE
ncbi:MAG: DUF885 domain-containing protein [Blastocatellia bacterium]|nr:DUF885 domain-containing protein [Blastocatellia bacterium]